LMLPVLKIEPALPADVKLKPRTPLTIKKRPNALFARYRFGRL
jgi:hypothetical protein